MSGESSRRRAILWKLGKPRGLQYVLYERDILRNAVMRMVHKHVAMNVAEVEIKPHSNNARSIPGSDTMASAV
jgi:hypothetical protein